MYETQLRNLHCIEKLIDAETIKQQIERFYLLPFDEKNCHPFTEESKALKKRRRMWDRTLLDWAHRKDNKYVGCYLKEAAEDHVSRQDVYYVKCHGQSR